MTTKVKNTMRSTKKSKLERVRLQRDGRSLRDKAPSQGLRGRLWAKYDSAQTTDENTNHWVNADSLSAVAALTPQVRQYLRDRTRYEVANNSYATGIVNTLANDTIGTGPRLQVLTEDAEFNEAVEREFQLWADATGLAQKLWTMRRALAVDGEAFAIMSTNIPLSHDVKLDLRLIEAERVASPMLQIDVQNSDGITFDDFGNPLSYRVRRHHPGGNIASLSDDADPVHADDMIHLFRTERPEQTRGVPELTPALHLFAQLRRYTLAVLAAAETAADLAGVFESQQPSDDPDELEALDAIDIQKRQIMVAPFGWKLSQLKAEQPTTMYDSFVKMLLNEIARCLNMPFNIAAANSAGYNFASGKLDHQVYFNSLRIDRRIKFGLMTMDRVFVRWLDEARRIGGLIPRIPNGFDIGGIPHEWQWDGHDSLDPREKTANVAALGGGIATIPGILSRQGANWEKEQEVAARSLGLTIEGYRAKLVESIFGPTPGNAQSGDAQDGGDDDDQ